MEIYTRPIKAGQLMQENPCQFVCDSTDLNVGHRVPGLATDVELEQGHPEQPSVEALTTSERYSLRSVTSA
nr:TPA_asm: hypothetical protein HUJ06_006131 [Nelumbo nucifera]